ncbi:MAG TPA: beta-hydroxyacyl-ACP dehydratase [Candidatus Borkfalkia avistercoris]|uniref:Beta-hydroxyacyl-ACP dehydratase n=1 Tax=Candidatus Borkfalkia avistercoris TaxID=2838504 RepID=A0A9D2CYD7_9FIRM|nr:beta-hydroxyacyl-ACP dehydratase [Candidatus Borkfalkia avistercoris]
MNRDEIKEFLPHREPMLLLDEVVVEDGRAIGKYTVRGDEFFLQGHFPGNPIVPGVIQCEMIAQTAVALLPDCKGKTPLYTGLNNVKFKNPLLPGDTAVMTVELTARKGVFCFAKGKLEANGKLCTSAEFSFAIIAKQA